MKNCADEFSKSEILQVADIYERLYYQFVDLMNFSYKLAGSYRKSDAVAAIISEEVSKIEGVLNNAVWIVTGPSSIVKMAQNGVMTPVDSYDTVDWNTLEGFNTAIRRQKVVWGPFDEKTKAQLSSFEKPMLLPVRGMDVALGFLVVEHNEEVDTERCQYITKFASMILEMSSIYFRLEDEIKERRLLQDLLVREKNKAQSYLDIAEVMLIALDKSGNVDLINRKGCQILGYTSEEVVGKNWFDNFVDPHERKEALDFFNNALADSEESARPVENSIINSRGESRIIAWRNTRVVDADGQVTGTISCGSDVTDQKKSEMEKQAIQEQLFQSQKMEAIGALVGGIAHDFNNMLQAIIGYSELVSEEMKPEQPGHRSIQTVIQTAKGGADLVRKLMTFGQQTLAFPVNFDLNSQISELAILLKRTLPQGVDLELDLSESVSMIHADPNQIDQCVMNIVINGSEAMPDGGRITVQTTNVFLDEEFCKTAPGLEPGNHVVLGISDTGKGMDEKTLLRIYEPFFSSKRRGSTRGTGLGLSVVKGILDKQGALISCKSKPGTGTTFTIYFQAVGSEATDKSDLPGLHRFSSSLKSGYRV